MVSLWGHNCIKMILASNGIIASQIATTDADALAFFNRVTTAGGSLSTTEKNATNQLVLDLKSYSIWTKMKAIYPMVGASAAACAQNLVSSSFTGTFNGGWTYASTGVTPNGTNGYMDTGFVPNGNLSLNNSHISLYNRTNTSQSSYDLNTGDTLEIVPKWTDSNIYYSVNSPEVSGGAISNCTGLLMASRIINNSQKIYRNNAVFAVNATNSTSLSNNNLILGALNAIPKAYWSNRQTAFVSVGDGLTDTEASNFYTAVNSFQVSLSRNV